MGNGLHTAAGRVLPAASAKMTHHSGRLWPLARLYFGAHGRVIAGRCLLTAKNALFNPMDFCNISRRIFYDRKITADRLRHVLRLCQRAYAANFDFRQRSRAFCTHFDLVTDRFGINFIEGRREGNILLWEECRGERVFSINLLPPADYYRYEAELTVTLAYDGMVLFTLGFVFCCPDGLEPQKPTAFITRLQGTRGKYQEIKSANKALGNLNLSSVLLASLAGICSALHIERITGVSMSSQITYTQQRGNFSSTYERFWLQHRAVAVQPYGYSLQLPLSRPTQTVDHQARSRHHEELRKEIEQSTVESVKLFFDRQVNAPLSESLFASAQPQDSQRKLCKPPHPWQ